MVQSNRQEQRVELVDTFGNAALVVYLSPDEIAKNYIIVDKGYGVRHFVPMEMMRTFIAELSKYADHVEKINQ